MVSLPADDDASECATYPRYAKIDFNLNGNVVASTIPTGGTDDSAESTSLKNLIAENTGSICGPSEAEPCTKAAVCITRVGAARRSDVRTETTLGIYSSATALVAEANLGAYVASAEFVQELNAQGGQFATIISVTEVKTQAIVSDTGEVLSKEPSSGPCSQPSSRPSSQPSLSSQPSF